MIDELLTVEQIKDQLNLLPKPERISKLRRMIAENLGSYESIAQSMSKLLDKAANEDPATLDVAVNCILGYMSQI